MKYIPTIGLEVHVELKTRTKMFCDSLNDPEEKYPNQNVCPVCLGHPGTLPTINQRAVEAVIKVGLAMGATIAAATKFDRKNYFYPDLPKGYQISQYDQPLVSGGTVELAKTKVKIRLRRIHLEEDTGRLLHDTTGETKNEASLVDFNRAGVPLMELVTEPDFKSGEEAVEFGKYLQQLLRYLEVSDADMEKGQMRVEANVSLGEWVRGNWKQGTKVEVKNLNSFKSVKEAIDYEIKRQEEVLSSRGKVTQETRGWNDAKRITFSQRSKEEAHDYRYFPEPDLPPFETKVFNLEELKNSLPELPREKRARFVKEFHLTEEQADALVGGKAVAEFFEEMDSEIRKFCDEVVDVPGNEHHGKKFREIKNFLSNVRDRAFKFLVNELQGLRNQAGEEGKITPEHLAHFSFLIEIGAVDDSKETGRQKRQDILLRMFKTGEDPEDIFNAKGIYIISDIVELKRMVREVIAENPQAVADYKKGKTASIQFLIGKAMGKLRGRGNPETLRAIFEKLLTK
ncbi:MAG: Asp-tRNA(Asn)/Glu-tRNA(Gln) amidotransferase subunit GatB [Candidatus Liptonbacteria bacterium]|nr:Asp-tRNA(Asn)/Glu-tRNA(Gln) amidotransferase subunit GatB [Candidatus Liptonbacteria bacterium]